MRSKFKAGLFASSLALIASTGVMAPSLADASPQKALNLDNEQGQLWPCAFTPFNGFDAQFSIGVTYETLDFINALQNQKTTPWLATAYAWSNANKTLTFTIRSGVKFSDGKPFSAADVVYSFNLLKKYPALDLNAIWSVLSSVTQSGSDKVVLNFSTAAVPYFYYVAGQVPMVPQHIWSKIANPVTDPISHPIGTGGYVMSKCTPQNIQWTANPHYWQPGMPTVKTLNMPAFLSNNTANEYLATGQSAYGAQFIPNIKTYFVAKKAGNGYWFPPVGNVVLFPNLKSGPTSDVAVRQAISYGINRASVSRIGEYGYEPPASQTGIVSPTYSSWSSSAASSYFGNSYNPAKAKSILKADGYKVDGSGVFAKNGKELSLTIITNGGYSDWVASVQVIASELAKVGIKAKVDPVASSNFTTDVLNGQFQLAYDNETGGPAPFYEMRQWMYSKNSAAIGKPASSNWERFNSPAVDKLLNQYGATTSSALQHSLVNQLQMVMVKQLPVIPVLELVDWFQYNNKEYSGFPSPSNPYAQPAMYNVPDWGVVVLHLKPLK
jgi:peptide/nickel transport system substrate-binding protein